MNTGVMSIQVSVRQLGRYGGSKTPSVDSVTFPKYWTALPLPSKWGRSMAADS